MDDMENDPTQTPPPESTPEPPAPAESPAPAVSSEEKNLSLLAHLLGLAGFIFPFGNIIGPLIVYLIKKDQSPFIRAHSVEALNFQISMTIYAIVSAVLVLIFIGFLMLLAVGIISIICMILAAIKAADGQFYRYPLTIRLVS